MWFLSINALDLQIVNEMIEADPSLKAIRIFVNDGLTLLSH